MDNDKNDQIKPLHCPNADSGCPIESDLASIREELDQLHNQVRTDYLSGLFNKRHMLYALAQEMERTQRSNQPTSLILLDVDHFKKINDTHGHVRGDEVITAIGEALLETVRKIDIACRYGGEEFSIILPSTPLLVGVQVAERIREKVKSIEIETDGDEKISFTVSVGVDTYFPLSKDSAEDFIQRVDNYLYQAKDSGRDCVKHAVHKLSGDALVSSDEKEALFDLLGDDENNALMDDDESKPKTSH